jgi:DnaJ-class molecular chaperone
MNVLKARRILELPEKFDDVLLKKNYRSLAMKYHPDKNKETDTTDTFAEINAAHEYLLKTNGNESNFDNVFGNLFKSFTSFQFTKPMPFKQETIVTLTAKEYITGTMKSFNVKERCSCEHKICNECGGCGYSLQGKSIALDVCTNCTGDGYTQNCSVCENGIINKTKFIEIPRKTNIYFDPNLGKLQIKIKKPYFLKENGLYCYFDISLKESLTGFNKIFKDPFGDSHQIITNGIVKSNDGYKLNNLILVFNVLYPEKLSESVVEQLKMLDF